MPRHLSFMRSERQFRYGSMDVMRVSVGAFCGAMKSSVLFARGSVCGLARP